jgi:hypothetical protein
MLLASADGTPFCEGACPYSSRPATSGESLNRIFIPIQIGAFTTDAALDTGGSFLILDPSVAEDLIGLRPEASLGTEVLMIRGERIRGHLYRVRVQLPATSGSGIEFEATVLVPELDSHLQWGLPTFLGWHCCMERIRFAVDPDQQTFFFGMGD